MIFQNPLSETLSATIHELGNQADLGSEQQNVTASHQLCCCQLQVDLGLAGAGDAPEQQTSTLRK